MVFIRLNLVEWLLISVNNILLYIIKVILYYYGNINLKRQMTKISAMCEFTLTKKSAMCEFTLIKISAMCEFTLK